MVQRLLTRALLVILCFFALKSFAAPPELDPNTVHYEYSGDSQKNVTNKLSGSIFFANNNELYLDGESTKTKDTSGNTSSSSAFEADLSSSPRQKFSGGAGIKWFGVRGILSEATIRAPLHYKAKNWKLELTPADGTIRFQAVTLRGRVRDLQVNDFSFDLAYTYTGFTNWDLRISTEQHDYNEDMTLLSTSKAARVFSNNTLSLAQTLVNYSNALDVTYHFEKLDVGASLGSSQSAFDKSLSSTSALNAEYFFNDNWSSNAELSRTKSEGIDPATGQAYKATSAITLGATYTFD